MEFVSNCNRTINYMKTKVADTLIDAPSVISELVRHASINDCVPHFMSNMKPVKVEPVVNENKPRLVIEFRSDPVQSVPLSDET